MRNITTVTLNSKDLEDLSNYCYDRQQATPFDQRNVNNFLLWFCDWMAEDRRHRVARQTEYIRQPEKRTPEFHQQLAQLAEKMGYLKDQHGKPK